MLAGRKGLRKAAEPAPPERRRAGAPGVALADGLALLAVLFTALLAFHGVAGHDFLNWDDQAALVNNAALDGGKWLAWAFSTTHMSHYQPLSWLVWGLLRRLFGASAPTHHIASLFLHLLNTVLVFALASRIGSLSRLASGPRRAAETAAVFFFAVHPLRVEPVAWASAFPYPLSLLPLLLSALSYLRYAAGSGSAGPFVASLILYAVSQLCRVTAPALPLALLALDFGLRRPERVGWRRALLEKVPYAGVALLTTLAEAGARRFAPLEQVSAGARLTDALAAPLVYLGRSLWPLGLSPLDVQPLDARASLPWLVASLALLAALTATAVRVRSRWPWLLAGWLAYLLLLGPASGLAPSGVQATADRYTYLPSVAVALLVGAGAAQLWADARRRTWLALGVALGTGLGVLTWRQVGFWRDSVTLWTRALESDPRNDVALYNLALALASAGEEAAAVVRYRELLVLIPDHAPARENLDLLEAARFEREAGAAAAAGRLEEAVGLYSRALEHDPARLHSRRSRGMALAQLGRYGQAVPDLRAAVAAGGAEPEVAAALAFVLAQSGEREEAIRVLREAVARHPGAKGLGQELARLEDRIRHQ